MSEHDYSDEPLTPAENRELRRIIESDKRALWLWSTLRTWAIWIAAVVGGATVGWDFLAKIVRKMGGP